MQQVARAAAAENAALREMLAARNVPRDEIDAHVVSRNRCIAQYSRVRSRLATRPLLSRRAVPDHPPQEKSGPPPFQSTICRSGPSEQQFPSTALLPGVPPPVARIAEHMPSSRELSSQPAATTAPTHDGRTPSHSPNHESTRHDSDNKQPQYPINSHSRQSSGYQTTCAGVVEPDVVGSSFYMHPIDPACYCPPEPRQCRPLIANGMSCLEAALILAQFRGHPDSSLAHDELGCAEGTDCTVRNTDVLQLMDKTT